MSGSGSAAASERFFDTRAAPKESAVLAAMVLAIGLLGFKVRDITGGLAIVTCVGAVACVVVLGFCGRPALIAMREGRPLPVALIAGPSSLVLFAVLIYVQVTRRRLVVG